MASDEHGRIYVRGLVSEERWGPKQWRKRQLAAPRVRRSKGDDHENLASWSKDHVRDTFNEDHGIETRTHIEPGDDPFLTQTLHVYFNDFPPHSSNRGHGHQNEAAFYVLEGRGYEIHDDERYDWQKGDFYVVHTDSVHRHFNPYDEPASVLIVKAKPSWIFMGLLEKGHAFNPIANEDGRYAEREEWGKIWTPGVLDRKKVVSVDNARYEWTPLGKIKVFSSPERDDVRIFSVDAFEWEIPAGSRSGRHWKMSDEILHVVSGSGYSLHWTVEAEIDERFYARIERDPTRHEIAKGDTLYVPQNTVTQHFAHGEEPLVLFSGQNRLIKYLGYNNVHVFEPAPEYEKIQGGDAAMAKASSAG